MNTHLCQKDKNSLYELVKVQLNQHYETVISAAKSTSHGTSLLADGIDLTVKRPFAWQFENNQQVPVSNFASQQNWLRFLVALSNITEDEKYLDQAIKQTDFFLSLNKTRKHNLFYWGGHRFLNLESTEEIGPIGKSNAHELKHHTPYYDFLHTIGKEQLIDYLAHFWQAHMIEPENWDFSRHGADLDYRDSDIFDKINAIFMCNKERNSSSDVLETVGLTFINTGTDLIYAASAHYRFTHKIEALNCARMLYEKYVEARNPNTGLPAYQYSSPKQREPIPKDDNMTQSWYGDRAKRQFGPEFGNIAREGNVLFKQWIAILFSHPLAILDMVKQGVNPSTDLDALKHYDYFFINTVDYLVTYYDYAYDLQSHSLKPLWSDGTDLTNYQIVRDGYYGQKGDVIAREPFDNKFLLPLVAALKLIDDNPNFQLKNRAVILSQIKTLVDKLLARIGICDTFIGLKSSTDFCTEALPECYDEYLLLSLIQISETKYGSPNLRNIIYVLTKKIIEQRFNNGLFVRTKGHKFYRLDDPLPLILVHFMKTHAQTIKLNANYQLPDVISLGGYIHGGFVTNTRLDVIFDTEAIYTKTQ